MCQLTTSHTSLAGDDLKLMIVLESSLKVQYLVRLLLPRIRKLYGINI